MNSLPVILVTGASGQLGNELQILSSSLPQYQFIFTNRETLPIDNFKATEHYFRQNKIDFCINCAAYTAVDKAETEIDQAFIANSDSVGFLANQCRNHRVRLIHISTDYVYGITPFHPLSETDPTNPINVYGQSKLKGEQLALENSSDTIIIRTSWLYSAFGNNFLKTMLRLFNSKEEIRVVSDQHGTPTYAAHLSKAIIRIIDKIINGDSIKGIYNFSNSGSTTWFHFAEEIKKGIGSNCRIVPIPTTEYPTPAKRPPYSVLNTSKIKKVTGEEIPDWKLGVSECIAKIYQDG